MCARARACVRASERACECASVRVCVHACACACACACVRVHTCLYVYIHVHIDEFISTVAQEKAEQRAALEEERKMHDVESMSSMQQGSLDPLIRGIHAPVYQHIYIYSIYICYQHIYIRACSRAP